MGMMQLFRPRLVLLNGVASIGGYMLCSGEPEPATLLAMYGGVSLLAAAGSALNQVMERDLDALMERTSKRPIPIGELSPLGAALIAVVCALDGVSMLLYWGGPLPAGVGMAALLWYLAVYTPLKRRTPFALLVGALCGAAPPVIGWVMAGGALTDFRIVLLAGILYLWQVPHFWLLQRRHAEEYRRAGFPLFTPSGHERGQLLLCMVWVIAMMAGAAMLPVFGLAGGNPLLWGAVLCLPLLVAALKASEPVVFTCLNLFPLAVTVAVCAGR